MKSLLSIKDLTCDEIEEIFVLAKGFKRGKKNALPLKGKVLGMIFEKPSSRTRVSFEVGMFQLGGAALFLSASELQLGRGETISDTGKVLSRYLDGILIRTFAHEKAVELAKSASVPIINGLSDLFHPCQVLSDIFTVEEKLGQLKRAKVAFVGDGNNVAHSWLWGAAKMGMHLALVTPHDYEPEEKILASAMEEAKKTGAKLEILHDPREAICEADIIYTDAWVSMGDEEEREKRLKTFREYQVNADLVRHAKDKALVMHCLPAHRGEEITDEVIDGSQSIVFDQAENRLHVQKGILVKLLGEGE